MWLGHQVEEQHDTFHEAALDTEQKIAGSGLLPEAWRSRVLTRAWRAKRLKAFLLSTLMLLSTILAVQLIAQQGSMNHLTSSSMLTDAGSNFDHTPTIDPLGYLSPLSVQDKGNFSSPPWHLNAHDGGPLPTILNGVLNTTTINPTATNYTGTYNSNVYIGKEDWCSCVPVPLDYTWFSISGAFTSLSLSQTNPDFAIETTFYYYLPSSVNGTNCGNTVTDTHWLDIEIFYSRYSSGEYLAPQSYIGCSLAGDVNYREVENTTLPGQAFQLQNFSIPGVYQRALSELHLPIGTSGFLSGIEIGTEGYGLSALSAEWFFVSISTSPRSVTISPPVTGGSTFDKSWSLSAVPPSNATVTSGVLTTTVVNTGLDYSGSYYALALKGASPDWNPQGPTLPPALPMSNLTVQGFLKTELLASHADFKIRVSLYFEFASPQTAVGLTGNWLDSEIIFSYYDTSGGYQPPQSYIGSCGTDCMPYREIIGETQLGQNFGVSNFNIAAFYQRALSRLGLPSTTQATFYGIEPGVEGDGVNQLTATYGTVIIGGSCLQGGSYPNCAPPTSTRTPTFNGTWHLASVSPSTASIANQMLTTTVDNTASYYTGSYYAVAEIGTFPWFDQSGISYNPPLSAAMLSTRLALQRVDTLSSFHYNVYIGLDYKFASPVSVSGASCSTSNCPSWLDTEIRFSSDSGSGTYSWANSIGWGEVLSNPIGSAGQSYTLTNFDIWAHYQRALAAWRLPSNTQAKLMGIVVGVEGYGINDLTVTWESVTLTGSSPINMSDLLAQPYGPKSTVDTFLSWLGNSWIFIGGLVGFVATSLAIHEYSLKRSKKDIAQGNRWPRIKAKIHK